MMSLLRLVSSARRVVHVPLVVMLTLLVLSCTGVAAGAAPAVRKPGQSTVRALDASGLELELGLARVRLDSGIVFVESASQEGMVEAVFVGRGLATLTTRAPVEYRQMMLFTGFPGLLEPFSSAVLTLGPGPLSKALLGRPSTEPSGAERQEAETAWRAWQRSPERRILGIDRLALRAKYHDPLARGTAFVLLDGSTLGCFFISLEPEYQEALTVGNVQTWDAGGHRRSQVRHLTAIGFNTYALKNEELLKGTPRYWLSTTLDGLPSTVLDTPPFEVPRMDLDVVLKGSRLKMLVRAKITLRATRDGERIVELGFASPVKELEITGPSGEPLEVVTKPLKDLVVLPSALHRGATSTIKLSYTLKRMEHPAKKAFAMTDPGSWIPWVGDTIAELGEVSLHWPRKLELLGPGTPVGREHIGRRYRTRTLRPASGQSSFPFAIGDFEVRRELLHGQEIVVAADRTARNYRESAADDLMASIREILPILTRTFGDLPYGGLTVVTADQMTSVSFPGFVLLASQNVADSPALRKKLGIYSTREGNLAFSIAQQWLGNAMRWETTRDVWWSRGGSDFVALHVINELTEERGGMLPISAYRRRVTPERVVLTDGLDPRLMASPTLNKRILTDRTGILDYIAVVETRGSQILALLDATSPHHDLFDALGRIVQRHPGGHLSTTEFLEEVGRELDIDAAGIATPFLDGGPSPAVVYTFSIQGNPMEGWAISGNTELSTLIPRATVDLLANGEHPLIEARHRWKVAGIRPPVGVPFGILGKMSAKDGPGFMNSPTSGKSSPGSAQLRDVGSFGTLVIDEAVFGFRVAAHFPPVGFFLNPHFEVPLIPVSQDYNPAYGALCLGLDQAAAGNLGNAAQYFKGVTDFCAHLEPVNSIARHLENECTFASMAAHVHLGELALAWGDLESAADHLESARADLAQIKKTFGGVKRLPSPASITVLAARIDLARGDAATARARLSAIASKDHKPLTPDGYAVLAVAAARSGHADEAAHARQAARILGMVSSEGGAGDTVH